MSYDQILLPAAHCDDADAADAHLDAQAGRPASPEAAALAARIEERCADVLSVSPLEAEGDTLVVPVTFRGVEQARRAVHEEARAAGFGVYDPQVGVVFDPRTALPGHLATRDGVLPTVTPAAVAHLVDTLAVDGFLVVTTADEQVYAQTYRRSTGAFDVERREGGPDRHFGTAVGSAAEVRTLLDAWLRGDHDTVARVTWDRVAL
ncbi:MAG TPA: hypothetical protein VGE77_14380 [Nocardioides sp.]